MILTPAEGGGCGDYDAAEEHSQPGHQQDVHQEYEHCCRHSASHATNMTLVNLTTIESHELLIIIIMSLFIVSKCAASIFIKANVPTSHLSYMRQHLNIYHCQYVSIYINNCVCLVPFRYVTLM